MKTREWDAAFENLVRAAHLARASGFTDEEILKYVQPYSEEQFRQDTLDFVNKTMQLGQDEVNYMMKAIRKRDSIESQENLAIDI